MRAVYAVILLVVCLQPLGAETREGLNNEGVRLFREGRYAEAEQAYRSALAMYRAEGQPDISGYAGIINNLASTLQTLGKIDEARAFLKEVISLDSSIPDDHAIVTHALNNLALLHQAEREYPAAIALHQRAAERPGDLRTQAGTLHNLGAMYFDLGQNKKAEQILGESIRLHKSAGATEQIPSSSTFLARLAWRAGDYTRSLALLDKCLELRREAFAANHPLIAISLNDIAERLRDMGRYPEADALFEQSIQVFGAGIGVDTLYAAPVWFQYAESKRLQNQDEQALAMYERSIRILVEAHGPGHARLINVYRQAVLSAAKLKRKKDAKRYEELARTLESSQVQYTQHTIDVSAFAPRKEPAK